VYVRDVTYHQGRLISPTHAEAVAAVRAKLEEKGWRVVSVKVRACPVQCFDLVWWEWMAQVEGGDATA